jgi:hypothetical protein
MYVLSSGCSGLRHRVFLSAVDPSVSEKKSCTSSEWMRAVGSYRTLLTSTRLDCITTQKTTVQCFLNGRNSISGRKVAYSSVSFCTSYPPT